MHLVLWSGGGWGAAGWAGRAEGPGGGGLRLAARSRAVRVWRRRCVGVLGVVLGCPVYTAAGTTAVWPRVEWYEVCVLWREGRRCGRG